MPTEKGRGGGREGGKGGGNGDRLLRAVRRRPRRCSDVAYMPLLMTPLPPGVSVPKKQPCKRKGERREEEKRACRAIGCPTSRFLCEARYFLLYFV